MKLKTQSRLLISGILIVPVLLIIGHIMYRNAEEDRAAITLYKNIAAILNEGTDTEDQKMFARFLYGMSRFGDIAIFNRDFTVIHSTIPQFSAGAPASMEQVFALMNEQDEDYAYSFESPRMIGNNGHILIRRDIWRSGKGHFRFSFDPIVMLLALFLFPVIFAIIMSLIITRSITRSVLVLEDATRRIAAGELDLAVNVKGSNEITSLTNSLNKMRNDLKEEERRRYRFIMGITHDLKTPLALIKGYAEAIADGVAEEGGAVEIIAAKADQLEGMINDLLDFVRMDSGEWRGQLKTVPVAAFLRSFTAGIVCDAELFRRRMEVNISLPDGIAAPLDERLAQRALENLVSNAIRYTQDGALIRLDAALAGNAIQLQVSDSGPGISREDLPHIFEIFYRGTSSRREQGMGLGLAVVKWVADFHGWQITAESEPGQGTRFTISIPPENVQQFKV
jgi:signal transduction histidine kinase